jgi:hypothetical protein
MSGAAWRCTVILPNPPASAQVRSSAYEFRGPEPAGATANEAGDGSTACGYGGVCPFTAEACPIVAQPRGSQASADGGGHSRAWSMPFDFALADRPLPGRVSNLLRSRLGNVS